VRYGYYDIPFEAEAREAGRRNAAFYALGRPLPNPEQMHKGAQRKSR
jgi:hypothetical protein